MTTAIAEYSPTESALAELRERYAGIVFDTTTTKGMAEAKVARAELRKYRIALESKRVEIKAPALDRCRLIDTEAKRITAELEALEEPIDETIKREERRKEADKAAREQAERDRTEARNRRFDAIKGTPLRAVTATVEQIEALIAETEAMDFSDIEAQYRDAAQYEARLAVLSLKAALDRRRMEDAEQERIKQERAELERLRSEEAARRAEAERIAAAERERLAEEGRRSEEAARAERAAAEEAARKAREDEQARIDAERAERRRQEDAERAEAAEKLRKEQAEAAAERKRLADERAAAERRARDDAIANATLLGAAADAVELLKSNGFADHIVTLKLESAIRREPVAKKAA
jgi:colicin import membrane protein